jgi:hypothetical protein
LHGAQGAQLIVDGLFAVAPADLLLLREQCGRTAQPGGCKKQQEHLKNREV